VVTDPPYGIGFHNERWDGQDIRTAAARTTHARLNRSEAYQAWSRAWGQEVLRVLKPGGQLLRSVRRALCTASQPAWRMPACSCATH
jgi:DNA modification methylase